MNEIIRVPFHGTEIITTADGKYVALRQVCEALGLDYSAQYRRIKRQPWACIAMMATQLPGDTQTRETCFIDRQTFSMWLATIDTSRVKNTTTRELVIAYQREAAQAIDAYFNRGVAINPRADLDHVLEQVRVEKERRLAEIELEERRQQAAITAEKYRALAKAETLRSFEGLVDSAHLQAYAVSELNQAVAPVVTMGDLGDDAPFYIKDYLHKNRGLTVSQADRLASVFGKKVQAAYEAKHGHKPAKYPFTLNNGRVREANAYKRADLPLLDEVFDAYMADRRKRGLEAW